MASTFALHNELVASIVRGFQRLRQIEIAHELAEEMVLEARMTVASSLDEQFDDEWAPSPEEIVAACVAIQDAWSDEEREQRGRFEYTSTRIKRQEADFYYQKVKTSPLNPREAAECKRYRERNRERLAAKYQDPAVKERRREQHRKWRERNSLRLKEYQAARRKQHNVNRKAAIAADPQRHEDLKRQRREYYAANRATIREQQREIHAAKRAMAVC